LAVRLAAAGHAVRLGSRDPDKATRLVEDLRTRWGGQVDRLEGVGNDVAVTADIVVLASAAETVVATAAEHADALAGRIVVSMANLLTRDSRGFAAVLPEHGSVAVGVQKVVPTAHVVGAFQNLPAKVLQTLDFVIDADVIVCGDDAAAVDVIIDLIDTIEGLHPIDGGSLVNCAAVEALTAVLLTVNRARKGEHGVRIVELRRRHH
jgi:NADPH-dependent F420 reductase